MVNNEGNAEIIGVVLLISIFVIAVSLMSVTMLSSPQPEKMPAVAFDFWSDDSHTNISLIHRGGETLNLNGTVFKVTYTDGTSGNPPVGINGGTLSPSSTYSIGDVINLTAAPGKTIDQVQMIWPGTGAGSMTGGGGPVLLGAWFPNSSSGRSPPAPVTSAVPVTFPYSPEQPVPVQTSTPAIPWVYFIANITATNGTLPINFTNLTENQGTYGLSWNFGDDSTSTDQSKSVTHPYLEPTSPLNIQNYTVTLNLTYSNGTYTPYSLSRPGYVSVYKKPDAQFSTSTVAEGNSPFTVTFHDESKGYVTDVLWTFGDGETSTQNYPTHEFNYIPGLDPNIYSVILKAIDPFEWDLSDPMIVKVHRPLVADFTTNPIQGSVGLPVQFTNTSTGDNLTDWSWNFGDASSLITTPNATHTFTQPGTYNVSLTITNPWGTNTTTKPFNVTSVTAKPVANFTATPMNGTTPLNVTFTDTSTNSPTNWSWNFGDGTNSTVQNPVHTYSTFGAYTVTLTATNAAGSNTSAPQTITVYNNQDTIRVNAGGPLYTDKLNNVWLADQQYAPGGWGYTPASNGPTFQTGASIVNTSDPALYQIERNKTGTLEYQFNVPNKDYNVQLRFAEIDPAISAGNSRVFNVKVNGNQVASNFNVYGTVGANTTADLYTNVTVTNNLIDVVLSGVTGQPPMISAIGIAPASTWVSPAFTANQTAGNAQLPVQFTDTSTGATKRYWDFGDGNTSTLQNPAHTYVAPGTYKVMLTAGNANQSRTVVKQDFITVYQAPVAAFITNTSVGNSGMNVLFTNQSTGYVTALSWDFGDGTTGTGPFPTHRFYNNGTTPITYTVTLNASNPYGSSTTTHTVTVHRSLVANFTFNPTAGNSPLIDHMTSTSTGDGTLTYLWDFGDGNHDTVANPLHTFTSAAGTDTTYQVNLKVSNDWGSAVITKPITVYRQLVPNFTASPTIGNSPLPVLFNASTSAGTNLAYTWNFGDGTSGTGLTPTHTYYNNGTVPVSYNVTLTINNPYGNANISKNNLITVYPPLNATFNATPSEGNAPMNVNFVDNSLGEAGSVSRVWTFGDGTTGSGQTPTHIYNNLGTYVVNLTIDNGFGTSSTTSRTVIVHQPLNASFTATPPSGNLPLPVQFNDTSTGDSINSWSWNFGDGVVSTVRNATHTYQSTGTFTVTMSVSNPWGTSTTTRTVTVISPLHASFSAATSGGGGLEAPRIVQFTDTSIGSPTSWQWTFGDGGTSTDRNPVHTYNTAGTYTVTLTISNLNGSDSTSDTISVITEKKHTISGIVYNDLNSNGHKDPSEPGIPGRTVFLGGASTTQYTTTGADGSYMFTGLSTNLNYFVSIGLTAGWQFTNPSTGSYLIRMYGQDFPDVYFGVFQAPLSGNVHLNVAKPGVLVAGSYIQFRFLKGQYDPQGYIEINGVKTYLNSNDVVKIVLESDQSGKIGTNSNIYKLNFQDVTLYVSRNGVPLIPNLRGAITDKSINSFDQFQSTLGVRVPSISAQGALTIDGNTIINSYTAPYDSRSIQLTNVTRQSDGQLNMEIGSTSQIDTGSVESCQLIP